MKIKFVGAINHITGSCSWLKYSQTGAEFLVDCGMYQGSHIEDLNAAEFPFDPSEIKFVLLTHAHIDHCGLLPKLYRDGFRGKVYATSATAKLAKIGLIDAAKIQNTAQSKIYTKDNVDQIQFVCVDDDNADVKFAIPDRPHFFWGNPFWVETNLQAAFLRSSHILGAVSITINWRTESNDEDKKFESMSFSGDIGNNTEERSYLPLMKPNKYPFPTTRYLLVESTYGHANREEKFKSCSNRQEELWRVIENTRSKQGKILIPVFSIHRSQEILIDLVATLKNHISEAEKQKNCGWKILFHSPMIAAVCQVYYEELTRKIKGRSGEDNTLYMDDNLLNYIDEESVKIFEYLFKTTNAKLKHKETRYKFGGSNEVVVTSQPGDNTDDNDIIVASSGMCAAGPICDYLKSYEHDPANTIVLTGYQVSPKGQEIQQHSTKNALTEKYAQVEDLSKYYSGHADQSVLLDYIFNINGVPENREIKPATVFINHGGNAFSKNQLQLAIEKQSKIWTRQRPIEKVMVAEKLEQWFDLNTGQLEEITTADLMTEILQLKQQLHAVLRMLDGSRPN